MPPVDYRSAIAAANRQFIEAFRRGDARGLAALYTADGQLLPPHSDMITGREGIRAFWQGALDLGLKAATLQTIEVQASGHLAVEVGKYTLVGVDGQVADAGKYNVVWRNDAGNWLLHRDIWNTSRPAPVRQAEKNGRALDGTGRARHLSYPVDGRRRLFAILAVECVGCIRFASGLLGTERYSLLKARQNQLLLPDQVITNELRRIKALPRAFQISLLNSLVRTPWHPSCDRLGHNLNKLGRSPRLRRMGEQGKVQ